MSKLIDLTGLVSGRLVVIKRIENSKSGRLRWLCRCNCKKEIIVLGFNLKNGHTKSCGCLHKEIMTKHGHWNDKIYKIWAAMVQRCTNSNAKNYKNYGGRGITVCGRWRKFKNFNEDMGENWKSGLTLERTNNELGYYRGNCEWATREKQNKNKRNTLYVEHNGKSRLFVELCEEYNMPRKIVYNRYYILGWTLEKALATPVGKRKEKK